MIKTMLNATTARCGTSACRVNDKGELRKAASACRVMHIYRIKGLLTLHFEMYYSGHALDYCGNLADFVALRILVSCWRRPDSYYSSHRCGGHRHPACHRSRGIGCGTAANRCKSRRLDNKIR